MSWQKFSISLPSSTVETLSDLLTDMGAVAITLEADTAEELFEPPLNETPLWHQTTIHALFELDVDLYALIPALEEKIHPQKFIYHITQVADQNWQKLCQDTFQPILFAEKLWLYPSWQLPIEDGKPRLLLDPGLAFGTGTHPTTALCLEWLVQEVKGKETVIDYGCGSGILALAALKLGADKVWGVDNDPQALEATLENAKRNQLEIEAVLPEALPPIQANILVANILANPLIQLAPHFASLVILGGKIALSGILVEQAEQVMRAYQPWFRFAPVTQKEQWVRLDGKRTN
jgi:ribosomal protein L11 methyltransferase